MKDPENNPRKTDNTKQKIVFLCTGNSCRSQMAEGFARHLAGDEFEVYSAGLSPAGLNPLAVEVMSEAGIDISHHSSDSMNRELIKDADIIITLCGDARDSCPMVGEKTVHFHWPLSDPAKAEGSPEEVKQKFREVRDKIQKKVRELFSRDAGTGPLSH